MLSSDLVPEVNRRSMASFTLAAPHPLLYISTTKRSIRCMWIDSIPSMLGLNVRATNVSVKSGKLIQSAQAVFLPHPQETEKWCHIPLGCGTESVRWTLTDQETCVK